MADGCVMSLSSARELFTRFDITLAFPQSALGQIRRSSELPATHLVSDLR